MPIQYERISREEKAREVYDDYGIKYKKWVIQYMNKIVNSFDITKYSRKDLEELRKIVKVYEEKEEYYK